MKARWFQSAGLVLGIATASGAPFGSPAAASKSPHPSAPSASLLLPNWSAHKIGEYVVRAEITIDAKGRPTKVLLLNPTDDEWANRELAKALRQRRFLPAVGSDEPVLSPFIVTTHVTIEQEPPRPIAPTRASRVR